MNWSPEQIERIAGFLRSGAKSATDIGKVFGVSRNAIIGLVHRNKDLKQIGLPGATSTRKPVKRTGDIPAKLRAPKTEASHKPKLPCVRPERKAKQPALTVHTNHAMLVQDWLAKNGGPRRFEPHFSSEYMALKSYLEPRGYVLSVYRNRLLLGSAGRRGRDVRWSDVLALVDRFRVSEGLQPMRRTA